jgi:hypothetical protein
MRFINVITNPGLKLLSYVVFFGQSSHNFQVFILLYVLLSNIAYQVTHTVNVVSQQDTTESFNEG